MTATADSPLLALEPRPIWHHFDGVRRVPRPSKKEEKIIAHMRRWAEDHGFAVREDEAGNMVVDVPASAGREAAPRVVLQSHLDMVCEKNAGVEHDWDEDPISVEVDGDWVRAGGTTLGADNGIGVAAAMAVAVDPEVAHGPLELLFTLDEETGLTGAKALDPSLVESRLLINLDTEEDDALYIGCAGAGGVRVELAIDRPSETAGGESCTVAVRGLRGGHSGVDIHENRGNALKILALLLVEALDRGIDFGLISLDGGSKANAIPRESRARLILTASQRGELESLLEGFRREVASDFGKVDPDLRVELEPDTSPEPAKPMSADSRDRLLHVLSAAPHGVLSMSREVPELVETSNNVASARTSASSATVELSFRSSVNAALTSTGYSLRSLARLAGGEVTVTRGYPGWKPDPESPLVQQTAKVYEDLFDAPPAVRAIHAGLECGLLVEKLPGLDAVSIGPEIRDPHSPFERVRISSVAKFYRLLKELLAVLSSN